MLDRWFFADCSLYLFSFGQLGISHFFPRIVFHENHTFFDLQLLCGYLEVFCSQLHENCPGGCTCLPQRRTEHFGAQRTKSSHIPGTAIGISHHHINLIERHVQFFGQHLGQGSDNALAHFDFAGVTGDPAVLPDMKISIEILRIRTFTPGLGKIEGNTYSKEDKDSSSQEFQEFPAVDVDRFQFIFPSRDVGFVFFHDIPPIIEREAVWMASIILL